MTISSDELYQAYKDSVGGTNHDGSFTLPDHVSGLGDRQQAGWQAAAMFCNKHFGVELQKDRQLQEHNRLQRDVIQLAEDAATKAATAILEHFEKNSNTVIQLKGSDGFQDALARTIKATESAAVACIREHLTGKQE